MKIGIGLVALALLVNAPALAQEGTTGYHFLKSCKDFATLNENAAPNYKQGFCAGMLYAILQQKQLFQRQGSFCIPRGVNVGQLGLVLVKYMDQHPDTLNLELNMVAMLALHDVWACSN